MFQGTDATLFADLQHVQDHPGTKQGKKIEEPPKTLPRSVGHHREWLDAIKTAHAVLVPLRLRPPADDVGHLGNIALWTGEKLQVGRGGRARSPTTPRPTST